MDSAGQMTCMSYFGNALEALLKEKNMKAVRLAELSGIAQSSLSRLITGEQKSVSAEDLESISKTISNDPHEQAELLRAHLLDECHGPAANLMQISFSGHKLKEDTIPYVVKLPDDLERHISVIRENVIKDRNVREIIEGLGNLLRSGDCRTDQELSAVSSTGAAESLEGQLVDVLKREAGGKVSKKKRAHQKSSQSPSA